MDEPVVFLQTVADRPHQDGGPGVVLRPGLAFGAHYDPDRTAFGALVAHNVDELAPGAAYGPHEHRDTEILTWVLAGTLVHVDPDGVEDRVGPGSLQYLGTGTGWHHDERAGDDAAVRAVQMWIAPAPDDPPPAAPERRVVTPPPDGDVVLAGEGGPVALRRPGVGVTLLRAAAGERRELDEARWRHVHVLAGSAAAAGAGDTLEITGAGPYALTAGPDGAELLVVATA